MLLKLNIIESYNYSNFDSMKLNNMQFVFHYQPNIISRLQIFMVKLNLSMNIRYSNIYYIELAFYVIRRLYRLIHISAYCKIILQITIIEIDRFPQNHPNIILSPSKRKNIEKAIQI